MTWWMPHKFEEKKPKLQTRMQLIKQLRRFFDDQEFWEVQTPVLQVTPVMDTHIHGFETTRWNHDLKPAETLYLQTSPEFDMKKLMVAGIERLYQICPVFRNAEGSSLHSCEFTMLEWYRAGGADYQDLMEDCTQLLRYIADALKIDAYKYKEYLCDPFKQPQKLSLQDAFLTYPEIDLSAVLGDRDKFAKAARDKGYRATEEDSWDDIFFRILGEGVEPHLGMDSPCFLYDYPAHLASLSRKKEADPRWAERFELYVCGIELANAFSELIDPVEQRQRFVEEMNFKEKTYGYRYPIDEDFLKALEYGLPESAGIALGVDRLCMLATRAEDIKDVLWTAR